MSPLRKGLKPPTFWFKVNPRPEGRGKYFWVSLILLAITPSFPPALFTNFKIWRAGRLGYKVRKTEGFSPTILHKYFLLH